MLARPTILLWLGANESGSRGVRSEVRRVHGGGRRRFAALAGSRDQRKDEMPQQQILDSHVHYEDVGSGVPYVFLHGNPASSYLWRNVIRGLESGRRLAPDLIGMGQSGKPDIAYSFADHARYLDEWFDALELETVVLVGHDWGGALAFDWAARHPQRVGGIVFLESIVKPMEWGV